MKKFGKRILHSLIAIVLCIFCSFSAVGCVPGPSNPGQGSGTVKPGGSTPTIKPLFPETSWPEFDDNSIADYNDVFAGVLAVYETDQNSAVFYDKNLGKNVSYRELIDRQFDTMASYLYDTLSRIYGTNKASNTGVIGGYKTGNINYNFSDTVSTVSQKKIAGLDSGTLANKETLNYNDAINGGYKITYKEESITDEATGTTSTVYSFDKYSETDKVSTNAWKKASSFSKDYLKRALMNIYLDLDGIGFDESETLNLTKHNALKTKYQTYSTPNNVDSLYEQITTLGFSKKYLWHVAYFLAYDVIGEANILNSINASDTIFTSASQTAIKPLTNITADNLTVFETYQNYKGYDIIIRDVVWNMAKLYVPTSGVIKFDGSVDSTYFNGSNALSTMFPRVTQNEYVYYDDIDLIADVKEEEVKTKSKKDDDEDYEDEEDSITIGGSVRKLKELIYIPHITNSKVGSTFTVDTLFMGFKSTGSQFLVNITYDAVYDNESEKAEGKTLVYDEEYKKDEMVVGSKVKVFTEYSDMGDDENKNVGSMIDAGLYTETEQKDLSKFALGDVVISDGTAIDTFVSNCFHTEDYTVTYPDNSTNTYSIARLGVYNNLYNTSGALNFTKNYFSFKFNYYTSEGATMDSIPSMYIMYLSLGSMD